MKGRREKPAPSSGLGIPAELPAAVLPIAAEVHRLHEGAKWSAQGQFEQLKLWRALNLAFGLPAAVLAGIAGGAGLAARHVSATPAILALISAGLGGALTALNPSRRVSQAQGAANAYLKIQIDARQLLTIRLAMMSTEDSWTELAGLTDRYDEVNRSADPPSSYAYWRSGRNIKRGGQDYEADQAGQEE
jgi:hypothetical protein